MGSALPWVDDLYTEYFPDSEGGNVVETGSSDDEEKDDAAGLAARWTPVVRSVGAFVGIAFAIVGWPCYGMEERCADTRIEKIALDEHATGLPDAGDGKPVFVVFSGPL